MYTAREIKAGIILSFSWKTLLFFFIYSVILCTISYTSKFVLGISFVPVGLIGTAVAFYVGFKNNSSYARLWEARKIWGAIVNTSRAWGATVVSFVKTDELIDGMNEHELHTRLIHGHIGFINALRVQLRSKSIWGDPNTTAHQVAREHAGHAISALDESIYSFFNDQDAALFIGKKNAATQIMKEQALLMERIYRQGGLPQRFFVQLMTLVESFYNHQGAAERIKAFPFPRQYAYFSKLFVWLFVLVLPFGIIGEFYKIGLGAIWLTVPCYMVIGWVFNTMEVVGDTSENPFENAINDIPMTAICRTIEIDLRERLGEENLPPALTPVNNILM
jgi:ion channel-forming bestrophin family protein